VGVTTIPNPVGMLLPHPSHVFMFKHGSEEFEV